MTKIEAYKHAAMRDGATEELWQWNLARIIMAGALPPDSYEEIPAGAEEAFIEKLLASKRETALRKKTDPRFCARMEAMAKRISRNN